MEEENGDSIYILAIICIVAIVMIVFFVNNYVASNPGSNAAFGDLTGKAYGIAEEGMQTNSHGLQVNYQPTDASEVYSYLRE